MTTAQKPTVLLAEDDPNDLFLVKRAIRQANLAISLQVVGNGEEAVNYLMREGDYADTERYPLPALILTNLKMPRMNGVELLIWVKQQPHLKDIPVVVMSGCEEPDEVSRVNDLGANSQFVKPLSVDALAENLKNLTSLLPSLEQE
ncbi:MAG: response regulator [Cyanobacteriota bacterium]